MPRTPKELWDWILGRDPLPPVSPDKTVEAAWLPQWLSRIVTDELVAAGIPAVVVDDFNLNLTMYTREPMSRIFVTARRHASPSAAAMRSAKSATRSGRRSDGTQVTHVGAGSGRHRSVTSAAAASTRRSSKRPAA